MVSAVNNRSFLQETNNNLPVTIETTSTFDFHESVSRPFAGISQQQISDLPIDKLYEMMSKNWSREKMMFDKKC